MRPFENNATTKKIINGFNEFSYLYFNETPIGKGCCYEQMSSLNFKAFISIFVAMYADVSRKNLEQTDKFHWILTRSDEIGASGGEK